MVLGRTVTEYFEDANGGRVVLGSGEIVTGDMVIGSDGVRSERRVLVLERFDKPRSSRYAVLRASFRTEKTLKDPITRMFPGKGVPLPPGSDRAFIF